MDNRKQPDASICTSSHRLDSKDAVTIHPDATNYAQQLKEHGLILSEDGYVRWEHRNAAHPRNWTPWRKAYDTAIIIFLEFVTTAIGTAGTPAAERAQHDYHINRSFSVFAFTSMPLLVAISYLIGQGTGGIFFPPYSETFGRKTLYIVSTLGFCIFCAVVAAVPSLAAIIISRFIAGVVSAVPTIVVAGSIEDIYNIQARVWMIFAWALVGLLALVVGPIFSTYVADLLGWRWVFYISTIITGVTFIACLFIKESRPSLLLERQVAALRVSTSNASFRIRNPDAAPDLRTFVNVFLVRPVRLLFTEPIIIMISIMGSVVCATFWLFAEALPLVYGSFGFSIQKASLAFIPIGIGLFFGIFTRLHDQRVLKQRRSSGKALEPEDKLFGFAVAAPTLAVSFWWFAWTVPPYAHIHWVVSMLALVPAGFALNEFLYTLSGYLADSYTIYAASAFAGLLLSRSFVTALVLPFTHQMYTNLDSNVASSILAAVATAFCVAPVVLIRYGKRIREASKFAKYSLDAYRDNQVEDDMGVALVTLAA